MVKAEKRTTEGHNLRWLISLDKHLYARSWPTDRKKKMQEKIMKERKRCLRIEICRQGLYSQTITGAFNNDSWTYQMSFQNLELTCCKNQRQISVIQKTYIKLKWRITKCNTTKRRTKCLIEERSESIKMETGKGAKERFLAYEQ